MATIVKIHIVSSLLKLDEISLFSLNIFFCIHAYGISQKHAFRRVRHDGCKPGYCMDRQILHVYMVLTSAYRVVIPTIPARDVFPIRFSILSRIRTTNLLPECDQLLFYNNNTKRACIMTNGVAFFEYFFKCSSKHNTVSEKLVCIGVI